MLFSGRNRSGSNSSGFGKCFLFRWMWKRFRRHVVLRGMVCLPESKRPFRISSETEAFNLESQKSREIIVISQVYRQRFRTPEEFVGVTREDSPRNPLADGGGIIGLRLVVRTQRQPICLPIWMSCCGSRAINGTDGNRR